ncbi:zinc metallopeptidase [Gammaproteobacteria bacterium]|nr:zinc metallopeptidase [Gammaproteobacteria bacterium]
MGYLATILIIFLILFFPSIWVQRTMKKYNDPEDRYVITGSDFARKLLDALDLKDINVEATEIGDHYDPIEKTVRLTEDKMNSGSLTSIVVAAHEVGHAHQDATKYFPLSLRTKLVKIMAPAQRVGAFILMAAPFVTLITRIPQSGLIMFLGGFLTLGMSSIIHLVTLPTEWDASFSRAMPMLETSNFLKEGDSDRAREILRAAAFTYLAGSLMSLLNIARWWTILRRGPL